MRGRDRIDLAIDPPPDVAVEMGITRSSLDRMAVYADLGVPEVWCFDGTTLHVERLQSDGRYAERDRSDCFPFLALEQVSRFLERRNETDETSWIRSFRSWVRGIEKR